MNSQFYSEIIEVRKVLADILETPNIHDSNQTGDKVRMEAAEKLLAWRNAK